MIFDVLYFVDIMISLMSPRLIVYVGLSFALKNPENAFSLFPQFDLNILVCTQIIVELC